MQPTGEVLGQVFAPDGKTLAAGGWDGAVALRGLDGIPGPDD